MDLQIFLGFACIILAIIVFLICREIVCWYFKMNEVVSLLNDIKTSLQNNAFDKRTELIKREIVNDIKNEEKRGRT